MDSFASSWIVLFSPVRRLSSVSSTVVYRLARSNVDEMANLLCTCLQVWFWSFYNTHVFVTNIMLVQSSREKQGNRTWFWWTHGKFIQYEPQGFMLSWHLTFWGAVLYCPHRRNEKANRILAKKFVGTLEHCMLSSGIVAERNVSQRWRLDWIGTTHSIKGCLRLRGEP
jgi:hypothetical protein